MNPCIPTGTKVLWPIESTFRTWGGEFTGPSFEAAAPTFITCAHRKRFPPWRIVILVGQKSVSQSQADSHLTLLQPTYQTALCEKMPRVHVDRGVAFLTNRNPDLRMRTQSITWLVISSY
jgi:hypothetical protein